MVTLAEIGRGYGLGVSSYQKVTPWFEGRAFMGEGREKGEKPTAPHPATLVSAHGKLLLGGAVRACGRGAASSERGSRHGSRQLMRRASMGWDTDECYVVCGVQWVTCSRTC